MLSSPPSHRAPGAARGWLLALLALLAIVLVIRAVPGPAPAAPLQLVALGPDGGFRDTLVVPASWRDTATASAGVVRVPLVLAVRNTGERPARPERLSLSLPVRHRLVDPDHELPADHSAGAPLMTYSFDTGLNAVPPGRLPTLLPDRDTLWLEVVIPSYHCVVLADSVPELIPAPAPSREMVREVRIFYSLEGADLGRRRTGTLTVRLDTALLDMRTRDGGPTFPVVRDTARATPEVGELQLVGTRRSRCGGAVDSVELRSTLWLTEEGGSVIALEYAGAVRKRLYDLDGDGVIERESWDADGDGVMETTRRARLPMPDFLLPLREAEGGSDTASVPVD